MTTSTETTGKLKFSALVQILGATLFVSAFLLFWSEPMVGKMVLPLAGGTAAVWATCILFFQIMLLAGYLYAHLLGQIKNIRSRFVIHALVLIAALAFLPIHFQPGVASGSSGNPVIWLLVRLLVMPGVPFFAVATNAPLLQNWLSVTTEESALDPYFLYAASNAGSLSALLIHPLFLESLFGVTLQARYWLAGYVVLILLVVASALIIWMRRPFEIKQSEPVREDLKPEATMKFYWVSVSFLPSALMLAVTNHISTNVTSAPFLWVIPLGVYLLTFILAFARRPRVSSMQASRNIPFVLLMLLVLPTFASAAGLPGSGWLMMGVHVLPLFLFDLLIMDAFSSDAVPAHLVSREALKLYLSKLAPDGILLFNCTNRFLDISRLVSGLVTDAGLVALVSRDSRGDLLTDGKLPSVYVVAARRPEDLALLSAASGWNPVARSATFKVWTDDYSSQLGILRFR